MPKKLTPQENLRNRLKPLSHANRQYLDCDYFDKLNEAEKEWYNKFNKYYYDDRAASVHKLKISAEQRRSAHSKNNSARKCVDVTDIRECRPLSRQMSTPSPEDAYIEAIDWDFSDRRLKK